MRRTMDDHERRKSTLTKSFKTQCTLYMRATCAYVGTDSNGLEDVIGAFGSGEKSNEHLLTFV